LWPSSSRIWQARAVAVTEESDPAVSRDGRIDIPAGLVAEVHLPAGEIDRNDVDRWLLDREVLVRGTAQVNGAGARQRDRETQQASLSSDAERPAHQ
jgi:hypothetical protein